VRDLEKALPQVERALMAAEDQVAELTRRLGEPDAYADPAAARDLATQHATAKDRAAELSARWEKLVEALERSREVLATDA
jgi:protein subunit release factor A